MILNFSSNSTQQQPSWVKKYPTLKIKSCSFYSLGSSTYLKNVHQVILCSLYFASTLIVLKFQKVAFIEISFKTNLRIRFQAKLIFGTQTFYIRKNNKWVIDKDVSKEGGLPNNPPRRVFESFHLYYFLCVEAGTNIPDNAPNSC